MPNEPKVKELDVSAADLESSCRDRIVKYLRAPYLGRRAHDLQISLRLSYGEVTSDGVPVRKVLQKALQGLRKAGKIQSVKNRWELVDFVEPEPVKRHLKNSAELYEAVYDILVEDCGAAGRPQDKASFVNYYLEQKYPATEFRFCGYFGFGGKFYRSGGELHVSYYPESHTPVLDQLAKWTNAKLAALHDEPVWGPPKDAVKEEA